MSTTHEQKFFNALRDIFVGARIEGDSGYINLMRIKSRYYTEGVFPKLMETIDGELAPFPNFREELFDKLYSFFKRYFSDSGSIYFRHTPYHQDIYERIYTDDRDVMLFWKTQNLYYVKTDRLFRSMSLSLDDAPDRKFAFDASAIAGQSFAFDASTLQNKRHNEKRNLIFEYAGKADDETLKFAVLYTEGGKKTRIEDIVKAIKKDGVIVKEDLLTRAFRLFERQSEVDFFINKNARSFLNEQFDLWMYQYLFKRETDFNERRIKQLQALKRVAQRIIEFISGFEDELVRIWNKPKFALQSNYVITFDRVFERSEDVARKLLAHENIHAQIAEWRGLGMIDERFTIDRMFGIDEEKPKAKRKKDEGNGSLFDEESGEGEEPSTKNTKHAKEEEGFGAIGVNSGQEKLSTKNTKRNSSDSRADTGTIETGDALPVLSAKYRYLPFDTRHFKSLEMEILSLFDNLDEQLDGRLVHSENYQALNTLKDKFREKVKCIYIDPPYNTNLSEIDYENNYKGASWLSLIENRLVKAKDFLEENGVICVTIDDYQAHELAILLDSVFDRSNQLGVAVIRINPSGRSTVKGFSVSHEYAFFYGNSSEATLERFPRTEAQFDRFTQEEGVYVDWRNFRKDGGAITHRSERPKQFYPLYIQPKDKKIRIPKMTWNKEQAIWDVLENPTNDEITLYPIDEKGKERVWSFNHISALNRLDELEVRDSKKNGVQVFRRHIPSEGVLPRSWFDKNTYAAREYGSAALAQLFGESVFAFAKSPFAVQDCIWASGLNGDLEDSGKEIDSCVLDFFGGSGTTAHAVINLNAQDGGRRKYIMVEANDYFHTVMLPRVKKVVFSDKWKDGTASDSGKGSSHFCKYFALEQYEDTLRRALYLDDRETAQPAFFDNPHESPFSSYVFLRDKKMSDALRIDYDKNKVGVDFSQLYEGIDLAETLSCVKGKFIRRVTADSVEFADGEIIDYDELDYRDILPLVWWDK